MSASESAGSARKRVEERTLLRDELERREIDAEHETELLMTVAREHVRHRILAGAAANRGRDDRERVHPSGDDVLPVAEEVQVVEGVRRVLATEEGEDAAFERRCGLEETRPHDVAVREEQSIPSRSIVVGPHGERAAHPASMEREQDVGERRRGEVPLGDWFRCRHGLRDAPTPTVPQDGARGDPPSAHAPRSCPPESRAARRRERGARRARRRQPRNPCALELRSVRRSSLPREHA